MSKTVYEAPWLPISTAPQNGVRVDIWAKKWDAKTDTFEFKRFTDCFWRSTHFANFDKDWHPTHWMIAPPAPGECTELAAA